MSSSLDSNTVHCVGSNCEKRYTCIKYYSSGSAVDWSTSGSGGTDLKDTYDCGPYSDPPYAKYQPCNQTDDGYDMVALGKPAHIFSWEERIEELEFENVSLKHELSIVERDLDNLSAELKEYRDFLEDLCDFLVWDTGKRAREARYKIEAFLKRMGEKND